MLADSGAASLDRRYISLPNFRTETQVTRGYTSSTLCLEQRFPEAKVTMLQLAATRVSGGRGRGLALDIVMTSRHKMGALVLI